MITVYRYDDQSYDIGQVVTSRGDHAAGLTTGQRAAEDALRAVSARAEIVRRTSLYTWEERSLACRLTGLKRRTAPNLLLYELGVDDGDVLHRGDVNQYTAIEEAIASGRSPDLYVEGYWRGDDAGAPFTPPRIEILVSCAKVLRII